MKQILHLLTIAALAMMTSCGGGEKSYAPRRVTDLEKYELRGSVKSLTQANEAKSGWGGFGGSTSDFNSTKYVFNEKGWVVETYGVSKKGIERLDMAYTYNAETDSIIDAKKHLYTYGNAPKGTRNIGVSTIYKSTPADEEITYNVNGDKATECKYFKKIQEGQEKGEPKRKINYTYDDNNLVSVVDNIQFKLSGEKHDEAVVTGFTKTTYKYNDKLDVEEMVEVNELSEDKRVITRKSYTYTYDQHGNWTERVCKSEYKNAGMTSNSTKKRTIVYYGE